MTTMAIMPCAQLCACANMAALSGTAVFLVHGGPITEIDEVLCPMSPCLRLSPELARHLQGMFHLSSCKHEFEEWNLLVISGACPNFFFVLDVFF